VDHADHVGLIRDGVTGTGRRWLELGAGSGAFTLALADVLGPDSEVVAVDRDEGELRRLRETVARRFPDTRLQVVAADFRSPLPVDGPFDGLLAANALHFVPDPIVVLRPILGLIRPGGRVVVVEYDADDGNRWVPYPFSFRRWQGLATAAGLRSTRLIGRVPSRFLDAIYASRASLPATPTEQVLDSAPHGDDREE
jgi:ubiquinone/menaquinone biosynthesis C-methylase UbiE